MSGLPVLDRFQEGVDESIYGSDILPRPADGEVLVYRYGVPGAVHQRVAVQKHQERALSCAE
jgi:hypothetical protein